MEPKLLTLNQVVQECITKGDAIKCWKNFNADIAKMRQYYGNQTITEEGQFVITEDAEVVSIETFIK